MTKPEDQVAGSPISEAEATNQVVYMDRALSAGTDAERRSALVDALITYGHRFGFSLAYVADLAAEQGGEDNRFRRLADEFTELLLRWVGGYQLTNRADEADRRAAAAVALADDSPRLGALAASAVLALPHPDVELARRLVEAYEAADGDAASAESSLTALSVRIKLCEPDEAGLAAEVERGIALEPGVAPAVRRRFRVAVAGRCLTLAVAAREAGDITAEHRLALRGVELLEPVEPDNGIVLLLSALFSELDDTERAAALFRHVLENATTNPSLQLSAAMFEARMRYELGDFERVVELLEPRLEAFEAGYLTAVADDDVESRGSAFSDVVINLAFAHARLGRWHSATAVLDRGKSRRARYRAALRAAEEGAEILERERELYALKRGAAQRPPVQADTAVDPLAAGVTPQASLLEAYRRLRPRLEGEALGTSLISDLAAVLAPDEAALVLGQRSDGMLLTAVRAGDTTMPALADFIPLPAQRWVDVLAPGDGSGFLTALEARADRDEVAATLSRMLTLADEAVHTAARELHESGVRRLVVVPHRFLHLVPFWAVPSLTRFQVETASSVAALVGARGEPAPQLGQRALVVVNPTGDLRVAAAEGDAVGRRLRAAGVSSLQLARAQATEDAVLEALGGRVNMLHFCGHGRSNLLLPERSALLVCPDPELVVGREDPFTAWMAAVTDWDGGGRVRSGDVPGVGRVIEEQADGLHERWLEYGTHGTFWTRYEAGRRTAAAELWSAGDMLVGGEFEGCALAFLSACESGIGQVSGAKLDEAAGLPAALHLAGAASVVATLWPVGDAPAVLFVDEFYRELAERRGLVNLSEVMHTVRTHFRTMTREASIARVDTLRTQTADPVARFTLERFARDLAAGSARPFSDPYEWAPFFVSGRSQMMIEEAA